MTLVLGTNCGFCLAAPTTDPGGTSNNSIGNYGQAIKATSPEGATKITEIGVWITGTATPSYELGVYSDEGNGEPESRLHVATGDSFSGSTAWNVYNGLDWSVSGETVYWLCAAAGNASSTYMDAYGSGGEGSAYKFSTSTLPSDWGSSSGSYANRIGGIYVVYETSGGGTNIQINVNDALKAVSAAKVNVDDAWKEVSAAKINVDDSWKEVF